MAPRLMGEACSKGALLGESMSSQSVPAVFRCLGSSQKQKQRKRKPLKLVVTFHRCVMKYVPSHPSLSYFKVSFCHLFKEKSLDYKGIKP